MRKTLSMLIAALLTLTIAVPAFAASGETEIKLTDDAVTVNGTAASTDSSSAVYVGADIVYYEAGHDASYGEGTTADEHSAAEAEAHTVVTITQPGTYRISGKLSAGQIAVDLGSGAKSDPTAVVTLILDGLDITCTVAPAVIFYNVYECGSSDTATASATVDTTAAGANVVIADGSVNNVNGSYVARIYKEGTTDKLHKYDGAFYSKRSMNVSGGSAGTGVLNIVAENEGLDSELHLTINGGVINVNAQNDAINTSEDGVSVTTINGGVLKLDGGFGVEGDGIDSNGYIVINGGYVYATAQIVEPEGGIDADLGIYINGGTVIATGNANGATNITSEQVYMELSYNTTQKAGTVVSLRDTSGNEIISFTATRDFRSLTISNADLKLDTTYHLYSNGLQQQYAGTGGMGGPGGGMGGTPPDGMTPGQAPDGSTPPVRPDGTGTLPDGTTPPERPDGTNAPPEGFTPGQMPGGQGGQQIVGAGSVDFTLTAQTRGFSGVTSVADASTSIFTDVDSSNKYYEGIQFVSGAGLMTGTGNNSFSPDTTVSRAMAITVLGRLANAESVESAVFSDVVNESWYSPYVGWAEKKSIITGYGNGKFGPNDPVSREQMCVILYNYAKTAGVNLTPATPDYSDSSQISSWAKEAVGACAASGLLENVAANGTSLNPQTALTRAELADMLMRFANLR